MVCMCAIGHVHVCIHIEMHESSHFE